jgi:hypothetical protein
MSISGLLRNCYVACAQSYEEFGGQKANQKDQRESGWN